MLLLLGWLKEYGALIVMAAYFIYNSNNTYKMITNDIKKDLTEIKNKIIGENSIVMYMEEKIKIISKNNYELLMKKLDYIEKEAIKKNIISAESYIILNKILFEKLIERIDHRIYEEIIKRNNITENISFILNDIEKIRVEEKELIYNIIDSIPFNDQLREIVKLECNNSMKEYISIIKISFSNYAKIDKNKQKNIDISRTVKQTLDLSYNKICKTIEYFLKKT